jgi:hypothetical protein
MQQMTLASQTSFEKYARKSRRKESLDVMTAVIPWRELDALIEPHYPKAGNGRHPVGFPCCPRIRHDQQFDRLGKDLRSHLLPPSQDAVDGKLCRIVIDTDPHRSLEMKLVGGFKRPSRCHLPRCTWRPPRFTFLSSTCGVPPVGQRRLLRLSQLVRIE